MAKIGPRDRLKYRVEGVPTKHKRGAGLWIFLGTFIVVIVALVLIF